MQLRDGTILLHAEAPYDPVKAHEYYIRTRKLKGRKKGRALTPAKSSDKTLFPVTRSSTYSVRTAKGVTIKLTAQQLAERRKYTAERIDKIKKRLEELNIKLRKMMSETKDKKVKSERKAEKKPTASEKTKAARESKQYREKNKQKLANKEKRENKKSAKKDPVAELENKIAQVKGRLTAVVAIQRALAGATKNI